MLNIFSILTHKHGKLDNVRIQETIERSLRLPGSIIINATIWINHYKCHPLKQSKVVISFYSPFWTALYDVHIFAGPNSKLSFTLLKNCTAFKIVCKGHYIADSGDALIICRGLDQIVNCFLRDPWCRCYWINNHII